MDDRRVAILRQRDRDVLYISEKKVVITIQVLSIKNWLKLDDQADNFSDDFRYKLVSSITFCPFRRDR